MYRFADQIGVNADKFMQRKRHSNLLTVLDGPPALAGGKEEQDEAQQELVAHLYNELIVSQCSVHVTSATAKLIVIQRENKSFPSEELK